MIMIKAALYERSDSAAFCICSDPSEEEKRLSNVYLQHWSTKEF